METYPGTDMIIRFCYDCEKQIRSIESMWLDFESNCVICTVCRYASKHHYNTAEEWRVSIVRVTEADTLTVNELEEG